MSDITYDNKALKKLEKALGKIPDVKVGILAESGKVIREKDKTNNAEIGIKHEYGLEGLPVRSFLRMPITEKLQSYLEESGAFDKDTLKEVIASGSLEAWLVKVGIVGERIVMDAFNTGGFGQWKPSDMRYKTVHQTLVETQQLRNSITSEVEDAS